MRINWQMAFTYAPFAVWALSYVTFVRRTDLRIRHQAWWMAALLACFSKFLCFKELGGHAFMPDLPALLIWVWDWAYSGAVILFALSVICLFRFRLRTFVLPLLAWGLAAWGLWNGLSAPRVREITLAFENLPAALEGYRIVHLSDLHCSSAAHRWRTQAVADAVNAVEADLVCVTGDNVDGRMDRLSEDLEPLAHLRARDGVWFVTGNHEHYNVRHGWSDWYRRKGCRFLANACVFPHAGLALGGVDDHTGCYYRTITAPPDVRQAFAAATNGEFRILLQHRPKEAVLNCREVGVDLQLSGHTHGGIAPGLRQLVEHYNAGFSRGVYPIGGSYLYVNSGCGQWPGFPMRFLTPSEIALITLHRK